MKKIVFLICIGLFAASHIVFSQAKFSEDRSRFSADLKAVMDASKNEQAIQIGQTFDGLWNGGSLTEKQKQQIYSILISIQKKRYKINPQYMGYFSLFNNAVLTKNVKAVKLDSLIYVTSQVLENSSVTQFQKYLDFLNVFFEKSRFYSTNFNRLNVQANNFNIWYVDPKSVGASETQTYEPPVSNVEKIQEDASDWGTSISEDSKKGTQDVSADKLGGDEPPVVNLPAISGPYIKIKGAVFTIATKNDSVSFRNVSGSAMAFNNIFVGDRATFDWSSAGLSASDVYAELDKFSMNLSKTELFAENATFTYKGKIEKPIKGSFAFKAQNKVDKSNTPYPAFASYSNKINLGNIGDGLSLTGGFSLSGKVINTASADMGNSTLTLTKAGIQKFKAVSKGFEITDSAVNSRQSAIIIPFSGDTILHFGVRFSYLKGKSTLKMTQSSGSFKNANFYDTYHKMEINSEAAVFDVTKNKIDFYIINARNQVPVKLYSFEYFDEEKYDQLKGLLPFHPLQIAIGYARSGKGNSFYADDLAAANKQNPNTVRSAMNVLAQEGFAEYNPQSGYIKLTKKAWHYYYSKINKKDYDGIMLQSLSPQKLNCSLDLTTKKMVANGVKRTHLCRPMNVFIEPDSSGEVIIEKNRKMTFNGLINAGRFQFGGKNYVFDYDSFMIRLSRVDVVNINISKDYNIGIYGGENIKHKKLGIELDKSKGELYISKPSNKSGRNSNPQFPIFHASTGGVVYFDKKEILGGAYDREVNFKIPPFTVDSLNSEQEQAVAFDGTFNSKGIFPPFKERLTLQHDLSLGFEHTVPAEGYSIYGTKGKYYDKISLNMLGIRGSGKLETMGSTVISEDLIFYPDSLIAIGSSATVKKVTTPEIHHPEISIEEHELKWFPKKDTLIFQTFNKPFNLFAGTATFEGKIGLTSKASFGDGKLSTHNSEIVSKRHLIKEESFLSRYSNFKINSTASEKPNMISSNVKVDFDLKTQKAIISPEVEGFASDTFPHVQYSTSISRCEWDLEKQTLTMGNKKDLKSKPADFYAVSKEADSLKFRAGYAFYDLKKQFLKVQGVQMVRVSDSEILPDSGNMTIVEGGKIETLKNATVRMDSTNKFHLLYNAKIDIIARNDFKGEAQYDYKTSEKEKHKQKVSEFVIQEVAEKATSKKRKVATLTRKITIAKIEIAEEDKLYISQGILFKGNMELRSNQKNPVFNGFVKLDLKHTSNVGSWIAYQRDVDSSNVELNLVGAKTDDNAPVSTGIHLSVDGSKAYSSFISGKENDSDKDIFKVSGNLKYDPAVKEYIVADPKKMQDNFAEGNLLSLNDNSSGIRYEGKANFIQPVPDFEIVTTVIGKGNLDSANYKFNTFMSIPMLKVNPAALASMASSLVGYAVEKSSPYANDYTDALRIKLVNAVGQKVFAGYEKQLSQGGQKTLSTIGKLGSGVVFSQVNLVWSPKHSAFYSKGLIGVSNILKKDINAMVEGYVEIKRSSSGDAIRILLTPSFDKWYYINYENYRLAMCSNDEEFTKAVQAKSKGETTGKLYTVGADPAEKVQFNKEFNLNYFGKEVYDEYKPAEGSTPIEVLPAESAPAEESPAPEQDSKKKKGGDEPVQDQAAPSEDAAPAKDEKKKKGKKASEKEILEDKQGF